MRSIFTRTRFGAVSVGAIVLVLILLYWLVVRADDSPALSADEATIIAGEHMASEYGGSTNCWSARFESSRDVWEVACAYADPAFCADDEDGITCDLDAIISKAVLVDDHAAEIYEPN